MSVVVLVILNHRSNFVSINLYFTLNRIPSLVFLDLKGKSLSHSRSADNFNVTNAFSKQEDIPIRLDLKWFFYGGVIKPVPEKRVNRRIALLYPEEDPLSDRIINQLMYMPSYYEDSQFELIEKIIVLYDRWEIWQLNQTATGNWIFRNCPVKTCSITTDRTQTELADLVIFREHYELPKESRTPKQLYMYFTIESPVHSQYFDPEIDALKPINWTSTYRIDSDIVYSYGKWIYYNHSIRQKDLERNFAENKTKLIAWTASNCDEKNKRKEYVRNLQKYLPVDTYGRCGRYKCPPGNACFEDLGRQYKFYLAFENSNCRDYITEKFFHNALGHDMIPIVMGARLDDYQRVAPEHSFIHVDEFGSPRELAEYLNLLNANDDLYNSYFKWKGTGELINDNYWCRVCALLHDEDLLKKPRHSDFNRWWRPASACTSGTWPPARTL